ncbi:HprK-related kinase B [Desulfovibrio inopinatus]|uniref:HprK-related kinase B n=1 Tax=Desulfovibrio inopinatus TaxID=102109 RepID=UPI00041B131A|nr:HprK-related kinase B [Desulfovibrio inopinatus]
MSPDSSAEFPIPKALTQETFNRLADGLLASTPLPLQLDLDLGGLPAAISTNNATLLAKLADYLHPFMRDDDRTPLLHLAAVESVPVRLGLKYTPRRPDPGKEVKEEWVRFLYSRIVHKTRTDMTFFVSAKYNIAAGPCLDNWDQIVNFLNFRFLNAKIGLGGVLCHASAVAVDQAGLMLAGLAGRGKSSLALTMMHDDDVDFISNDRAVITTADDGPYLFGSTKLPRVNPGTILHNEHLHRLLTPEEFIRFKAVPENELWTLEQKYDASIESCFGHGRQRLAANLSAVGILTWDRIDAPAKIVPVNLEEKPHLLQAFIKQPGIFIEQDGQNLPDTDFFTPEDYLEVLQNTPVYEITGGIDFVSAAKELRDDLVLKAKTLREKQPQPEPATDRIDEDV